MMKKKDLRRTLLSEKGFCENLSMKELHKESVAWKIINDLGLQLTTKFPKDKDGKSFWQPLWELNQIRSRCIRISCCMSQESLENEFEGLVSSFPLMVKLQAAPLLAVQIVLTWSVLEFMKNPSLYVRRYKKAIELMLSCERLNQFNSEQEQCLLSIEEQTEYRRLYDWMYNVLLEIKSIIKKNKEQDIYIQISPKLEVPQNISGNWMRPTNNFDLARIGEILTLWKTTSERIAVLKHIKNDCEACNTLSKDVRIHKVSFLNELIEAIKKDTCATLLCCLQEQNVQYENKLRTLQDDIEKMNIDYMSKSNKMEGKVAELDLQVKEQSKTIQRQDGYISFLQDTNNIKESKVRDFCQCVTFPENAKYIIKRLHELIDIQTLPKQIVMPLRAAVDAGVIRRPSWGEFCAEFGSMKLKSSTSYSDYLNERYKYTDEAFNLLVKEFVGLRKPY